MIFHIFMCILAPCYGLYAVIVRVGYKVITEFIVFFAEKEVVKFSHQSFTLPCHLDEKSTLQLSKAVDKKRPSFPQTFYRAL